VIAAVSLAVYALTPFRASFVNGRSATPHVTKSDAPTSRRTPAPAQP
jgi:hypothetical protein